MSFDKRVRVMLRTLSAQIGIVPNVALRLVDPVSIKLQGNYESDTDPAPPKVIAMIFATTDEVLYRKYLETFEKLREEGVRLAKTARGLS